MALNTSAAARKALLEKQLAEAKAAEATAEDTAPFDEAENEEVQVKAAEVEAEQIEEQVETTAGKVPATTRPATGTAVTTSSSASVLDDSDDDGFGDLDQDLGFGSFPMVKLDGNMFVVNGEEYKTLDVQLLQTKQKMMVKARAGEDCNALTFTYIDNNVDPRKLRPEEIQNLVATDGTLISDHCEQWVEDGEMEEGAKPVTSVYREVIARVFNTGTDLDGSLVILNVAPASKSRLAGYRKALQINKLKLTEVLTRLQPGPKIVKGSKSFYPWDFKLIGKIEG